MLGGWRIAIPKSLISTTSKSLRPKVPPTVTLSHAHSQTQSPHPSRPHRPGSQGLGCGHVNRRRRLPPTLGALVSGGVRAVRAQGDQRLPEAGPLVPPPSDSVGGAGPGAAAVPRPAGPLPVLARHTLGGVTGPHTSLSAAGTFSVSSPLPSTSNRSAGIIQKLEHIQNNTHSVATGSPAQKLLLHQKMRLLFILIG